VAAKPPAAARRLASIDGRTALTVGLIVVGALLRSVDLGRPALDFDETFTAMAARMPFGQLVGYLRRADAHPPLDYLLRRPIAAAGAGEAALRAPSVILSVAALVVFAVWMRRRGWIGLLAIAFMAVASFQITYARDARMYAGMTLVGVCAAFAADRWLETSRTSASVAVSGAVLVGLFLHASTLVMAAGLGLIPGLRRDSAAWEWRAGIVAALAVWGGLWGSVFREQARRAGASWIPHTSPDYLARTLNELVSSYSVTRLVVVAVLTIGTVILMCGDRHTARLLACCFVFPVAMSAAIGLRAHFLLPRSLAYLSWAPLLAMAAVVEVAFRRWFALGVVALAGAGLLLLPSTAAAVPGPEPATAAVISRTRTLARDGDAVAVHPQFLGPLTHWYLSVRRPGPERSMQIPGLESDVLLLGPGAWDGRVWLIEPTSYSTPRTALRPCAAPWTRSGYRLLCLARS